MSFSIIIPVYNVASYLRQCLDSVLNQTFDDWEAICVNDGSTDGSAAILDEYAATDGRFRIITQSNGGLSAARNAGLKIAQGEYVLFLDSDDWLEHIALQTLNEELRMKNEELEPSGCSGHFSVLNFSSPDVLCFGGRRYIEATNSYNPADMLTTKTYATGMDYYYENALAHRDFAFVCVVLRVYKRTFLLENGLKFKEGIYHEDNLFTPIACYYATDVHVIDACLYNYRVRANSITTTFNLKRLQDFMRVANELATFFIPKTDFNKTKIYRSITHHYQVVFLDAPKEGKKRLNHLCDWKSYKIVSRTKLRHRINYHKNWVLSRICL